MAGQYKREDLPDEVYDIEELGQGLKRVSSRKVDFTHDNARLILEDGMDFAGDRPLRQSHVDSLVKHMQRGTFCPEWVHIIVCLLDGRNYRMNGQHTAWARLEMPEDWPCHVNWEQWEAKSMEDMRRLYCSIDRAAPRTKSNVVHAYLAQTREFGEYKAHVLRILPQGFSFWRWPTSTERARYDGDEIAYLLKTEFLDVAKHVCILLDGMSAREHRHLVRAPVVAAVCATMEKVPVRARAFWQPVADGVGFEGKDDPRKRLRDLLMTTAVSYGGGSGSPRAKISQEAMYRACLFAWRAWRSGKKLKTVKLMDSGNRPSVK